MLADLDGDGDLDALISAFRDQLGDKRTTTKIWTNDGLGSFSSGQALDHERIYNVRVADVDNDGDLDLLPVLPLANIIWLNDGAADFTSGNAIGGQGVGRIEIGDIDTMVISL